MSEAERLAQAIYETTAVDVANALAAETLDPEDVPDDLLTALSDEGIEPDDDPDESAGWRMTDDGPVAE
jgi:uncharacterized protein YutE (UPF0331/DUF86 family)